MRFYVQTRPIGWWGPVHREAVRRGLVRETPKSTAASGPRPLIRRTWTAEEAAEWSREDWIAIVLSPVVLGCLMIGVASILLLRPGGIVLTVAGVSGALLLYWVIDPKLRAVSAEYEARQAADLVDLERQVRWQERAETPHPTSEEG